MYRRAYTQHKRRTQKLRRRPYTHTFRGGTSQLSPPIHLKLKTPPIQYPDVENIQVLITNICSSFADITNPFLHKIRDVLDSMPGKPSNANITKLVSIMDSFNDTLTNMDFDIDCPFGSNKSKLTMAFMIIMLRQTRTNNATIVPPEIEDIHSIVLQAMRKECTNNARINAKLKDEVCLTFMREIAQNTIDATEYIANAAAKDVVVLRKIAQPMTEKEKRKMGKSTEVPNAGFNTNKFISILLKTHCNLSIAQMVVCHPAAKSLIPAIKNKIQILGTRDFRTF